MFRQTFGLFVCLGLVAGCSVNAEDESSADDAVSAGSDRIGPTFQADGRRDPYLASIQSEVMPYCMPFMKTGAKTFLPGTFDGVTFGKFAGAAGKQIAYGVYPAKAERAAMILVPGRTESFGKYCEFIYDLRSSGVSVYAMDLRGQGWSDRLLSDDPQKGYIDSFDYYVDDIKTFRDTVFSAKRHKKTLLFAHSTGGGAATLYLERHTGDFDAAILSSPMQQINTWEFGVTGLTDVLKLIGKGDAYAAGRGPYTDGVFSKNDCEHSPERWKSERVFTATFPETAIGGPTNDWVNRSIDATHTMKSQASKIATPYLLLQARQDQIVVPAGEDEVCNSANAGGKTICTKVSFGDPTLTADDCQKALDKNDLATAKRCAGHELLFEGDAIRAQTEAAIASYVDGLTR